MSDLSLALQVALDNQKNWKEGCVAWVESRDSQCGKKRSEGFLCPRHISVAKRRAEVRAAKLEAYQARKKLFHDRHIDEWRERIEKVEAEIERRTGVLTTDRAAYGGVGVPAVARHNQRQFSDSNVERVGELLRQKKDLEQKLRGIHGA